MNRLKKGLEWLQANWKNKYLLTSFLFFLWLSFFDTNSLIEGVKCSLKIDDLKSEKVFYENEITKLEEDIIALKSNSSRVENIAREKYFMHREGEDVYIISNSDR